jgi:hypothetical protein
VLQPGNVLVRVLFERGAVFPDAKLRSTVQICAHSVNYRVSAWRLNGLYDKTFWYGDILW